MTHNCKRQMDWRGKVRIIFCLLIPVLCLLSTARADGIQVRRAEMHYSDGGYLLSGDFEIDLNFVVEQALEQGVPLYFVSEYSVTHPRWYWLDDVVEHGEQVTKLSYNTLARQYRITRGALFQNFASLGEALRIIGHQATPIPAALLKDRGGYLAEKLLNKSDSYVVAVRLRLDVTQLPKPLQVNALAGDDWNLDSGWYRWIVRSNPAAPSN